MRRLLPALLILAACSGPKTPAVPSTTLRGATDSLTIPDLDITQAIAFGPGRWAVLSQYSGVVRVVDWPRHTVTPLGRPGKDYLHPSALFTVGETLYVSDWGLRQTTAWSRAGKLLRTIPAPAPFAGALPLAADAAGRLYTEARGGQADSGSVLRWQPGAPGADTVARLAPYSVQAVQSSGGQRLVRQVYSGNDIWGVFPSGALWVARVTQNRLDQRDSAGKWTRGPMLPDAIYPVTHFDKDYFVQGFPEDQRAMAEQLPFAPVKAAFDAVFVENDSEIWMQSSRSLTDSTRGYKVLDRLGGYAQQVRLPSDRRILGAGGGAILVAEQLAPGKGFKLLRYPSGGIP